MEGKVIRATATHITIKYGETEYTCLIMGIWSSTKHLPAVGMKVQYHRDHGQMVVVHPIVGEWEIHQSPLQTGRFLSNCSECDAMTPHVYTGSRHLPGPCCVCNPMALIESLECPESLDARARLRYGDGED